MTPELIAILALGITLVGLLITSRRDARADMQTFREEVRTDNRALRAEVHADNQRLRQDVQALAERTARLEGAIQGLFTSRHDPNRRDDAA